MDTLFPLTDVVLIDVNHNFALCKRSKALNA